MCEKIVEIERFFPQKVENGKKEEKNGETLPTFTKWQVWHFIEGLFRGAQKSGWIKFGWIRVVFGVMM